MLAFLAFGLLFAAGGAPAPADLSQATLRDGSWTEEAALDRATALWREGKLAEAEAEMRAVLARTRSTRATELLVRFLLGFSRFAEIPPLASDALERDPKSCALAESWGVAEAAAGRVEPAASLFRRAVRNGCPPFRWTGIGPMPGLLSNPAFADLLDPRRVLDRIGSLPEDEAVSRLSLLAVNLDGRSALPLADLVRTTTYGSVRRTAVALLGRLGAGPMNAWSRILASGNILARRVALQQILQLDSQAFVPLLSEYLERESLPGNRALASLALARLLAAQERTREASALLREIREGEELHPVALADLAAIAEREGRAAEAAALREEAKLAADRQRMIRTPPGTPPARSVFEERK